MSEVSVSPRSRGVLTLEEATRAARAAALAAMADGMSESEAARQFGVTRMTIRAWKGAAMNAPGTNHTNGSQA